MSDERIEDRSHPGPSEPVDTGSQSHPDSPQADPEARRVGGAPRPEAGSATSGGAGLFDQGEVDEFSDRWEDIQVRFVDQPKESVAAADRLVDDVVNTVTSRLSDQRRELESLWQRDEEVTTEQLRQSLQRYHALFDRLLSTRTPGA